MKARTRLLLLAPVMLWLLLLEADEVT